MLTAFIVGLIASISSCMAVVGGLVLSMSATFSKEGDKLRPQILFHIGRLASFFFLGGLVGLLGSAFQLNSSVLLILNFIIAFVMLILGLKLLNIFPGVKNLLPTLPDTFSQKVQNLKNINHTLTPLLIGIATFFLPCGFTQSMQIYTLSTGSFWVGAFTMFLFALGTFPVLALLSFGSLAIHKKEKMDLFMRIAGLIVIIFAIFNFYNALRAAGVNLNYSPKAEISTSTTKDISVSSSNVSMENGVQIITLQVKGGYSPRQSVAQAGIPTVIRFVTNNTFDCSISIRIPSLNLSQYLPQTGSTDIKIGTQSTGTFRGSCGMGMYPFEVEFK